MSIQEMDMNGNVFEVPELDTEIATFYNSNQTMYSDDGGNTWWLRSPAIPSISVSPWAEVNEIEPEEQEVLYESPAKRIGFSLSRLGDELVLSIEVGKKEIVAEGKELGMIINDLRAVLRAFDTYLLGEEKEEENSE